MRGDGGGQFRDLAEAELHRKDVPSIFATGYGEGSMIPDQFKHVPVVRKPYTMSSVAQGLSRALTQSRR